MKKPIKILSMILTFSILSVSVNIILGYSTSKVQAEDDICITDPDTPGCSKSDYTTNQVKLFFTEAGLTNSLPVDMDGTHDETIQGTIYFLENSDCNGNICTNSITSTTGGTHYYSGPYSHKYGWKIDIDTADSNKCGDEAYGWSTCLEDTGDLLDLYVKNNTGKCSDGDEFQYVDFRKGISTSAYDGYRFRQCATGALFTHEKTHWDNKYIDGQLPSDDECVDPTALNYNEQGICEYEEYITIIGDFNGDGKEELITGSNSSEGASIFSSDSGDKWDSVNWKIKALTGGDFDEDGQDELIMGAISSNGSAVFRSEDSGENWTYIWGVNDDAEILTLAAGDFDSDGDDELISGFEIIGVGAKIYKSENATSILPNDTIWGPNDDWEIKAMTVGDYDGDLDDELVTGFDSYDGTAVFRSESADGNWTKIYNENPAVQIKALTSGDYDLDGDEELISGFEIPDGAALYRSEGALSITSNDKFWGPNDGWHITSLTSGNINGDSADTLVTALRSVGGPVLYSGEDVNDIGSRIYNKTLSLVTKGDFDGDGDDELITAIETQEGGTSFYKSENGIGLGELIWGPHSDWSIIAITSGDYDSDGDDELIAGFNHDSSHIIYKSESADGSWTFVWDNPTNEIKALTSGDFDEDGDDELISGFYIPNQGYAIYKSETASSIPSEDKVWGPNNSLEIKSMTAGDYDGDDDDELVAGFWKEENNAGSGLFISEYANGTWSQIWGYNSSWEIKALASSDLDGDGDDELVSGLDHNVDGSALFLSEDASGVGTQQWGRNTYWEIDGLVAGDFNGNGDDSLITALNSSENIAIYTGDNSNIVDYYIYKWMDYTD